MAFTVQRKALQAAQKATQPRIYWDWRPARHREPADQLNGTAPVHLFYGLQEALRMIAEKAHPLFARHRALRGDAPGAARSGQEQRAGSMPPIRDAVGFGNRRAGADGHDAREGAARSADRFNVSLGGGARRSRGKGLPHRHMGD